MSNEKPVLESIDVMIAGELGFSDGWHSLELEGHKWMDGPSGRICFTTDGSKKYLEICGYSGQTPGGAYYLVQVYVNGDHHETFELSGKGKKFVRSFRLPDYCSGDLQIEFRSDYLWKPSDVITGSSDSRQLGALALCSSSLNNESTLERIDVRETGNLGFGEGWQVADPVGHKWMNGSSGKIHFNSDGKKKYLEIGYVPAVTPGGKPNPVQLYVNGVYHETFMVTGIWNKYVKSFPLPEHKAGALHIEFRSDYVWKPTNFDPDCVDKRQLGAIGICYALLSEKPNKIILNQVATDKEIQDKKIKISSYPSWMILGVTNRCNLKCVMCGSNVDGFNSDRSDLPDERLDKIREIFPYLTYASISGGEPMLYPRFGDVVKELGQNGVKGINFYSNGLLLTDAKADLLLEYADNISFIAISIDAATEETYKKIRGGNFIKLISNIGAFSDKKRKYPCRAGPQPRCN
jgi:hypothetical protein